MGRSKLIDRHKAVEVQIPESIISRVRQELYSEIEGKVPFGAMSGLVAGLMINWLRERGIEV